MSEALWAQIISGAFGLASIFVGTYLPTRMRRRDDRDRDSDRDRDRDRADKYYRPRRRTDWDLDAKRDGPEPQREVPR